MMNMAGMNPVAGGPVGGGMMMMNNGSPATHANTGDDSSVKINLNTYMYDYLLKLGHYDIARAMLRDEKFEMRTGPKQQSPGRRKDGDMNGDPADSMDMDLKDDIPDDLPRPSLKDLGQGNGFLFEWFSIFSDLFAAHRNAGKMPNQNMTPATQYLLQHQQIQRMRETQQNQNLARPNMMQNQFMRTNGMRNGIINGNMTQKLTPQQIQALQNRAQMAQQQQQQQQQQNIPRSDQSDGEINGRPGSPTDGENGGSPSKRARLDGQQQFNNGMMPNGRPGIGPQNMMIQSGFNPNMNQAQFRQNGAMPQKPMQPGMANGMNMMANAGSPMMNSMPNFAGPEGIGMDMYPQGRMPGQGMQGAPGAQSGNHALQDYQMQLMLLEQQNKKRLMMARQEQHENTNTRDGAPMPGVNMQPGMSPSGSRSGTSPNPTDQTKRTPQLGGLPASPSAGDAMQGRSPAPMGFMNGMQPQDFNGAMGMMGPGGPGMRPPTSIEMNTMARQQQGRMANQFQGGQPMVQQASQGQPQPIGTPGQRNEMPPPQAPAPNVGGQRNQPVSPAANNAPPTPSQTNKANPKNKKGKDEPNRKRPAKKNSTANNPSSEDNAPEPPTPSTPITSSFNGSAGKGVGQGLQQQNQQASANTQMPPNQQMSQTDIGFSNDFAPDQNFNLDFSTLENTDVLENFDFDSFLNTSADDAFNFDASSMGVDADFGGLHTGE